MANGDHKLVPSTLWAQRKDKVYLTIDLEDVKEEKIKLDEKSLYFSCKGGVESKEYEVTYNFHKDINPDPHWLRVDFDKWRDEDDSDVDEEKDMAFEDMMSQMGNFNTGGPEEPESEDSDDEELPDLE